MSDSQTSLQELKDQIDLFCKEREWGEFHGIKDLAIGAATESAELLEIFRFIKEEDCEKLLQKPEVREDVADEISDILFFVLRMANKYNFDLSESFRRKMDKNAKKYPVEKAKGSNKKYSQL